MKTTTKPHAWFFACVKNLEGYDKEYAKIIREGLVCQYSDGKTDSLADLYKQHPFMYYRMKYELQQTAHDELDKARKRLIAVLFSWFKNNNQTPSMQYVKVVACKAAKVESFNDIPLTKLKSLYRIFGTKNTSALSEIERDLLWSAMKNLNLN